MIVGVMTFRLSLPGCRSLKEKRMVVRSLRERVRNRFNVSVAETGHQDVWTVGELTIAVVSTDRGRVDGILDRVDNFLVEDGRARISIVHRELF